MQSFPLFSYISKEECAFSSHISVVKALVWRILESERARARNKSASLLSNCLLRDPKPSTSWWLFLTALAWAPETLGWRSRGLESSLESFPHIHLLLSTPEGTSTWEDKSVLVIFSDEGRCLRDKLGRFSDGQISLDGVPGNEARGALNPLSLGTCTLLAADVALLSKTDFRSKWCMGAPSFQIPAVVQMKEEQRFYIKEKKREKIDIYQETSRCLALFNPLHSF